MILPSEPCKLSSLGKCGLPDTIDPIHPPWQLVILSIALEGMGEVIHHLNHGVKLLLNIMHI